MSQSRPLRLGLQITDREEIGKLLDDCERCRLGFSEDGVPYILPLNYGYTYEDGVITAFFHSGREGRKLEIIKKNPVVCFEVDCDYRLNPDENEARNAVQWDSLIGTGTIQIITDLHEKKMMLGNMIKKYRRYNPHYRPTPLTDSRVYHVLMLKLVLDEFKVKRVVHS